MTTAQPVRLLQVLSYGRSGSTILANALGSLPGWASIGEALKFPNKGWRDGQRCACGEHLDACDVWGSVIARLESDGHTGGSLSELQAAAMSRRNAWRWLVGRLDASQREFRDVMESMLLLVARSNGASTIIDSTEQLLWGRMIRTMPSVNVQTIALIRDPRAAAFSWSKKKRRSIHSDEEGYLPTYGPFVVAGAAVLWDWIGIWLRRKEEGFCQVYYEEFATRPHDVLLDLIGQLGGPEGIAADLFDADGRVVLGLNHTFSGNPSRFRWGPVDIRLDDEWRRKMRPVNRAIVTVGALPVLVRHGYFRSRP